MTSPTPTAAGPGLDLDAARRESAYPDGIPLTYQGQLFVLPAELPADVIDPWLSDDLDLAGLVKKVLADDAGNDSDGALDIVLSVLEARPQVLSQVIGAVKESLALLFGADDYARFVATRPSLPAYGRLIRGLLTLYGVSLGEAFASPSSSTSAGLTQKQTSSTSTTSTPDTSGDVQVPETASQE